MRGAGVTEGGAPRPPQSKADYVYATLRNEIVEHRLPGGSSLRQDDVARRLGVSITPVREALRRLENDRLVTYEAHRGATVVDLGPAAVEEFYHLRAAIEGLAARLAAERITPEELAALRGIHTQMSSDFEAGRLERLAHASQDLHYRIADIGGPELLGQHTRALRSNHPVPSTASLWLDVEAARELLVAHERLLAALEAGDASTAERVMVKHIEHSAHHRLRQRPARPPE